MSGLYSPALVIHVVVAVLGPGSIASVAIMATTARRAVRLGSAREGGGDAAMRRLERTSYAMCALVAAITVLMEVKPF